MIRSLVGKNTFLLKGRLDALVNAYAAEYGDMALERIDGEEANYEQIVGAVESIPFLASKKLVVIRELGHNKAVAERIEEICGKTSGTTDLIFVEQNPDKRSVYYKYLKKHTDCEEFVDAPPHDLTRWIIDEAKNQGATISSRDAQYMVERIGTDQRLLHSELTKLVAYNSAITKETIDLLTEPSPEGTVFSLLEAAFGANPRQALKLYEMQRLQRVEPQAILGMFAWQMHTVALVKSAGEMSVDEVASKSGVNPFVVRKTKNIAAKLGPQQIRSILEEFTELDTRSKRESINMDDAMKGIILKVALQAY